jgi:hypothetical protein
MLIRGRIRVVCLGVKLGSKIMGFRTGLEIWFRITKLIKLMEMPRMIM